MVELKTVLAYAGVIVAGLIFLRLAFGFVFNFIKLLISLVLMSAFFYVGHGWQVHRAQEEKLTKSYQEGKISKERYDASRKQQNLLKTLLNPKLVILGR
jgi:threonine/homoserine/homoserine lactone efflux protein